MKFTFAMIVASVVLNASSSLAASGKENIYSREVSDVELQTREPFFPLLFAAFRIGSTVARVAKGVHKAVKVAHKTHNAIEQNKNHKHKRSLDEFEEMMQERDMEDLLDARDLFGEEVFEERDFDELD